MHTVSPSSSNERVKSKYSPVQEGPRPALQQTTQGQGRLHVSCQLWGAEGTPETPHCPDAPTGLVICCPSKFRSGETLLNTTTLALCWVCSLGQPAACHQLHPSVGSPRLQASSHSWNRNGHITLLPGPLFPPVICFSVWGIWLDSFSGRGNQIVCRWFPPLRFHTNIAQQGKSCCLLADNTSPARFDSHVLRAWILGAQQLPLPRILDFVQSNSTASWYRNVCLYI